jgi:hypothetical protein
MAAVALYFSSCHGSTVASSLVAAERIARPATSPLVMPRLDRGIFFCGGEEDCPLGGGQ